MALGGVVDENVSQVEDETNVPNEKRVVSIELAGVSVGKET